MKKITFLLVLTFLASAGFAQVKIHSHNDYEQKFPFTTAYNNSVYQIEADVWEVNGTLLVAHNKKDINPNNTLDKLYLQPIDSLFKRYSGKISSKKNYRLNLMIDFKTDFKPTYQALQALIEKYQTVFDKSVNKYAVSIIISGNRPPDSTFHSYPRWLYFDGLPNIEYHHEDFNKVTMISDNFSKYSKWKGIGEIPTADKIKLKAVMEYARNRHRYVRFWGAPDTQDCWRELAKLSQLSRIIIINTDKIVECTTYFEKHKNGF